MCADNRCTLYNKHLPQESPPEIFFLGVKNIMLSAFSLAKKQPRVCLSQQANQFFSLQHKLREFAVMLAIQPKKLYSIWQGWGQKHRSADLPSGGRILYPCYNLCSTRNAWQVTNKQQTRHMSCDFLIPIFKVEVGLRWSSW